MRSLNPALARSFDLYRECRNQILFSITVQSGKDSKVKITPYTTGFAVLPEPGSMLDQPHRLMAFFELFKEGDHLGTLLNLNRS